MTYDDVHILEPGTLHPAYRPITVRAADGSVSLDIETVLAETGDQLILGCQKISTTPGFSQLPCLVKYSDDGIQDVDFGEAGYASINLMRDASTKNMGNLLDVRKTHDNGYLVRLEAVKEEVVGGVPVDFQCVALARFTQEGQRDTRFGTNGIATFLLEPPTRALAKFAEEPLLTSSDASPDSTQFPDFILGDVKILDDNKILIFASGIHAEGHHRPFLIRLLPNGALDESLNGTGKVELKTETWFRPHRIALQTSDDKFVISGERPGIPFIARFLASGEIDKSYAKEGYFIPPTIYRYPSWHKLLPVADGGVVAVGHAGARSSGLNEVGVVAVCNLDKDGHAVVDFNGGEVVLLEGPSSDAGTVLWGFDTLVDLSKNIVIAGRRLIAMSPVGFIARLKANGQVDSELGENGIIFNGDFAGFNAIAAHPDGKGYYAVGYIWQPEDPDVGDKLYRIVN